MEEQKENLTFTPVPNNMVKDGLKPKEILIYLTIRKFEKSPDKPVFPSLQKLSETTAQVLILSEV